MMNLFTTKYPHACRCAACENGNVDLLRDSDGRLYCQQCIDRQHHDWQRQQ